MRCVYYAEYCYARCTRHGVGLASEGGAQCSACGAGCRCSAAPFTSTVYTMDVCNCAGFHCASFRPPGRWAYPRAAGVRAGAILSQLISRPIVAEGPRMLQSSQHAKTGPTRIGPRHSRFAAGGFRVVLPFAERYFQSKHIYRSTSNFAAERRKAVKAFQCGEPAYLVGMSIGGFHNTGVALVELTRRAVQRSIVSPRSNRA